MAPKFAGLDVSTQSCKLIVIDIETQKIFFDSSVNYDHDFPEYRTENGVIQNKGFGISESDPKMWVDAINALFQQLSKVSSLISDIRAISVSGQQHGLVTLTSKGKLSRPYSKLWNDFSTQEECKILTEKIGGKKSMIESISNTQRTGYTAPKILHLFRNEPERYQRTKWVLLVHNYINWILTGGTDDGHETGIVAMEPGDVSGSALWDPVLKTWAKNVIDAISPNLHEKLPPIFNSRKAIGTIGKNFVNKYGFSADCLIASGSGDNMMSAIGTGNYHEGVVTISLGTSGTVYTYMEKSYVDPKGEIACFCDATGNYLPLLCISNLSNGYDTILQKYQLNHNQFIDIINQTNPGNDGRILIPWYMGERTPDIPDAVPIYFGFGLNDFTKERLCRAVLEGHVMNLYEGFSKLPVKTTEIRLTGGLSQSLIWCETIANIFNCEVVPVLSESAALGAALHAVWTIYSQKSISEVADPFIKLDEGKRIKPDPIISKKYEEFKKIYLAVSKRMQGIPSENPFNLFKSYQID